MSNPASPTLIDRAAVYAKARNLTIEKILGGGYDGLVVSTNQQTAIKVFQYPQLYQQELAVYLRFRERQFFFANEFKIPRLVNFEEPLSVIEMSIVSPPFIVDFASVVELDKPPQFEPEILEEARRQQKENFESDWPRVKRALWKLAGIGVHLADVHPGNVRCR